MRDARAHEHQQSEFSQQKPTLFRYIFCTNKIDMSGLETAAAAIKDQTAKFQATVDQWVQSQQQQVDEVHKGHRDTMMLAEGTTCSI